MFKGSKVVNNMDLFKSCMVFKCVCIVLVNHAKRGGQQLAIPSSSQMYLLIICLT